MKTYLLLTISFLVSLSACGDGVNEQPYTKGVASQELAHSYCLLNDLCLGGGGETVDDCVAHNVFHLCELGETCDDELEEEAEMAVAECSEALLDVYSLGAEDGECFLLSWGWLPDECEGVFDYL